MKRFLFLFSFLPVLDLFSTKHIKGDPHRPRLGGRRGRQAWSGGRGEGGGGGVGGALQHLRRRRPQVTSYK